MFLYAPIAILLVFSFNKASVPTFPLNGFTFRWYHDFATNGEMQAALKTSAVVATISSVIAVTLGILAALALSRRPFRGKGVVTALLLTPLVIPLIVLGISLLLLYHQLGIQLSILTVAIGHVVISLPYTILVLLPRLAQIDRSLAEAAYDLGAGASDDVPPDHAPAHPAGRRLSLPDRLHDVVRRVRGRVVHRRFARDLPALPLLAAALPRASSRR